LVYNLFVRPFGLTRFFRVGSGLHLFMDQLLILLVK
jgi:hypothetical protein